MIVGVYKMHMIEINNNRVCNYYFDNLTKANKFETKNTLVDEKSYKVLVIYFTSLVHRKLIKPLAVSS